MRYLLTTGPGRKEDVEAETEEEETLEEEEEEEVFGLLLPPTDGAVSKDLDCMGTAGMGTETGELVLGGGGGGGSMTLEI